MPRKRKSNQHWPARWREHHGAIRTQEGYRASLTKLRAVFGHFPPSASKPHHVYSYMKHRPPIARNREKAVLSAVMTECVRWGAVDRNLVREVKRNPEKPRSRYVEDEELETFLGYCSPFLRAYVRLKMLTGLRQGQLLALKASDWDGSWLTPPAAKGGHPATQQGKGQGHISEIHNLVPACGKCNQSKGNKNWKTWMLSDANLSQQHARPLGN